MLTYLAAFAVIFGILAGGIAVDRLYRRFARRNPQLGPFRKPGAGCCGNNCETTDCDSGSCDRSNFDSDRR